MRQCQCPVPFPLATGGPPAIMATSRPREEFQQGDMSPQYPLLAVRDERIEVAQEREELAGVLLHPAPGAHLQRQGQEDPAWLLQGGLVEVVPEVTVGQLLATLRFEDVAVVAEGLLEQILEGVHFRKMADGDARVRVGEPDPVGHAETGVAIHRDAEGVG